MSELQRLQAALQEISQIAREAKGGKNEDWSNGAEADAPGCVIKALPSRLVVKAAEYARSVNPVNAPIVPSAATGVDFGVIEPMRLAIMTAKYWGSQPRRLTVSFLDGPSAELRRKIVRHMNAWTKTACISFAETSGTGNVRIARAGSGYWSYLGTDIMLIPANRPTMNLQGFSTNTPDAEFYRVVRHETGHTLGFPHEHMRKELIARLDKQKTYDYFWRTYRWDKPTVDAQVLTPLDQRSIVGTAPDDTSIMCYQLPGSITKDGRPIPGGLDINQTDYSFAGRIYPKGTAALRELAEHSEEEDASEEWSETEDVETFVS